MLTEKSEVDRPTDPGGNPLCGLSCYPDTCQRFGQTRRIASFLWLNRQVGGTFSMSEHQVALRENRVRVTIGHRVPQERLRARGAGDAVDNWRTECARHNEPVRDATPTGLGAWTGRRTALFSASSGGTPRSEPDRVYDQVCVLAHDERDESIAYSQKNLGSHEEARNR